MKFLVLATLLASCSAASIHVGPGGYLGGGYVAATAGVVTPFAYSGPLNLNTELTSFANGAVVPVDEPRVAAARADHLSSHSAAASAAPLVATAPAGVEVPFVYSGPLNLNTELTSFPNGAVVPVDEPRVAAARAEHLSSHSAADSAASFVAAAPLVAAAPAGVEAPFVYSGPLNLNTELTSFPNGAVVPVDEPRVAAARADHLSSHSASAAPFVTAAPLVAATPAGVEAPFVYSGPLNLNTELTSFPNGAVVPVDDPRVAAARADHLSSHSAAASAAPFVAAATLAAAAPAGVEAPFVYSGPLNLNTELTSFPNGAVVPVDDPRVAAARADHLSSHSAAASTASFVAAAPHVAAAPAGVEAPFVYSGPLNLNTELKKFPNGAVVPVDEPAVAAARAEHLV